MKSKIIAAVLIAASATIAAPLSRAATARHRFIIRTSAHLPRNEARAYKPLRPKKPAMPGPTVHTAA
jgi:hypothetical protein